MSSLPSINVETRRQARRRRPRRPRERQPLDEHVLERRHDRAHARARDARRARARASRPAPSRFVVDPHVQAIAEQLHALAPETRAQNLRAPAAPAWRRLRESSRSSRPRDSPARRARAAGLRSERDARRSARLRRDTAWPSRSSGPATGTRRAASRTRAARPDRRRSSARRARAAAARARACTRARASASCRRTADRRAAARNGTSPVSSSRRVRRAAKSRTPWISREELDVLVDRQVAVEAEPLRDVADRRRGRAAIAKRIDAKHRARARRPARAARRSAAGVVVLPAPSGPMTPNISPRPTSKLSPSTALGRAERLADVDELDRALGPGHGRPPCRPALASSTSTGMPGLRMPLPVVDRHLHAVHELRALGRRLDVARRELRPRRDEGDASGQTIAGVGDDRRRLIDPQARHERLLDVRIRPRVVEIDDDDRAACRRRRARRARRAARSRRRRSAR